MHKVAESHNIPANPTDLREVRGVTAITHGRR
jgi:hypothetical protein